MTAVLSPGPARPLQTRRRFRGRLRAAAVVTVASLLAAGVAQVAAAPSAAAAPKKATDTGFVVPFSGPSRYEGVAPTLATDPRQVNQPLGQARADAIASKLGLHRRDAFTDAQYQAFISGGGVGGDPDKAKIDNDSAAILTNTTGRPLISAVDGVPTPTVLGSYGLYVNPDGVLMSPANDAAPTRQINEQLAIGGYLNTWMRNNGATRSLVALYRSPYVVEAAYGFAAQHLTEPAELVPNVKGGTRTTVGMSMAPALWIVNFILLYILNPKLAAAMPAYWTPIPPAVASAIRSSSNGQVPYSQYRSYFP